MRIVNSIWIGSGVVNVIERFLSIKRDIGRWLGQRHGNSRQPIAKRNRINLMVILSTSLNMHQIGPRLNRRERIFAQIYDIVSCSKQIDFDKIDASAVQFFSLLRVKVAAAHRILVAVADKLDLSDQLTPLGREYLQEMLSQFGF